jgi:beta-mannosidase
VEAFTEPEDRTLESPVMALHQKHDTGLEIVREYMARRYRRPKDFPSFLYVSQLLQAEGMALAFEAQRRAMPHTMGTLYWQLNDTWPVASWSSLDYFGRWKALHYAARAAFAPVLVSPLVHGDFVEVHVVSDRLEPSRGRLELRLLDFDGAVRWSEDLEVTVEANAAAEVFRAPLGTVLAGADPARVVLQARLLVGETTITENLLYFVRPKDLRLPQVQVVAKLERDADVTLVQLSSDALAKNVHLTAPGAEAFFDDNYFDLLPGREKIVRVEFAREVAERDMRVQVRTLRDSY